MSKADRLVMRKPANWKAMLALALSLGATPQQALGKAVEGHFAGIGAILKANQGGIPEDREQKERDYAKKLAERFAKKIDELAREESALKKALPTLEARKERLRTLQNERAVPKEDDIRERMVEEDAARAVLTLLRVMSELKGVYPNLQELMEKFPKDRRPEDQNSILRVTEAIEHLLALPPRLKEQMILLELIFTHGSD